MVGTSKVPTSLTFKEWVYFFHDMPTHWVREWEWCPCINKIINTLLFTFSLVIYLPAINAHRQNRLYMTSILLVTYKKQWSRQPVRTPSMQQAFYTLPNPTAASNMNCEGKLKIKAFFSLHVTFKSAFSRKLSWIYLFTTIRSSMRALHMLGILQGTPPAPVWKCHVSLHQWMFRSLKILLRWLKDFPRENVHRAVRIHLLLQRPLTDSVELH